jgi:hypothetical protein
MTGKPGCVEDEHKIAGWGGIHMNVRRGELPIFVKNEILGFNLFITWDLFLTLKQRPRNCEYKSAVKGAKLIVSYFKYQKGFQQKKTKNKNSSNF